MTTSALTALAASMRWTVTGTSTRGDVVTLYLVAPSGRRFQLSVEPGWDEQMVVEKLKGLALAPF